jgi:hypothetical protein
MRTIPTTLAALLCTSALLAGCNLPNQGTIAQTAQAQTVEAAAAQTVQAAAPPTATFTMVPFPTIPPVATTQPAPTSKPAASATSSCDDAQFVTDVTIPDNTPIGAGDDFSKTWRLKNAGDCSWTTSYALVFLSGTQMEGPNVQALTGTVNSGQTVDLTVDLTAPDANGTYTGHWGLRNGAGVIFARFYVQIVVNNGTGGPFAVTHVTYTFSTADNGEYHGCPNVIAHIATNGAGDVQYHFTRSDGTGATVETLHFSAAGTQDVNESWLLPTSAGSASRWIGIYIDSPNHQDFGHLSFTSTCSAP